MWRFTLIHFIMAESCIDTSKGNLHVHINLGLFKRDLAHVSAKLCLRSHTIYSCIRSWKTRNSISPQCTHLARFYGAPSSSFAKNKIHIFKPPCHFLFFVSYREENLYNSVEAGNNVNDIPGKYATRVPDIVSFELYKCSRLLSIK